MQYRKDFCETTVQMGRDGNVPCQIARELNVTVDTLYEWARSHDEYKIAFRQAVDYADAWWADVIRKNANNLEWRGAAATLHHKFARARRVELHNARTLVEQANAIFQSAAAAEIEAEVGQKLLDSLHKIVQIQNDVELRPEVDKLNEIVKQLQQDREDT